MDSYDVLLMQCDGAHNGTTIIDDTGKTITVTGTIYTKTNHYKMGTASAYFNGSSYATLAASADWQFGTGDFTIELYLSSKQSGINYPTILAQEGDNSWGIFLDSAGKIGFYNHPNTTLYWNNTAVNDSTWKHIAFVRYSGNLYCYVEGVSDMTPVAMTSNHAANNALRIGYDSANYWYNGYLDYIRIAKGIARYTADFTPPAYYSTNYLKRGRGRNRLDMLPVSLGG